MKRLFQAVLLFLFLLPMYGPVTSAHAADIRGDEIVTVGPESKTPYNLYLFGNTINLYTPVQEDVIAGGKEIFLDGPISGSVMAAGQNLIIKNTIGNSIRAAGGNLTIDSNVLHDVAVAGGDITITKTASVGGDVLFAGGNLNVNGPVKGNVRVAGGNVVINSTVGGNIDAHVGTLKLGPNARIGGQLKYSSEKQAAIDPQAKVAGKVTFDQKKDTQKEHQQQSAVQAIIYKLVVDIIICLLLIHFLRKYCLSGLEEMKKNAWKKGSLGFGFLFLFPLAAIIMLILIWLGLAAILFYAFVLIVAMFIAKIFAGDMIMRWYQKRNDKKHVYQLDWKAGVVGPLVLALIGLIPVLGWLLNGILYLVALGAVIQLSTNLFATSRTNKAKHLST